ncbi:tetratricopeptide repeat protein [Argonema galeatum]|uniref:tetratricopeptide repeat protein n=1 Tax=Argonema galeatum TaxID=2942762 RepID=UPI002011E427|nr:tetratricopeptide repeat protein [Argonema galeatum]MCL1466965.1 tetratricopeptide repeat protein [Argonema galeatum A003/A1]
MFKKPKTIYLLLAAVISLGFSAFGCSSNTSNSNTQATSSPQTTPNVTEAGNVNQSPSPAASALPEKGSANDYDQQGMTSANNGDLKSAEAAWRKSIELDPKNVEVRTKLGRLLQEQGKLDEATTQYQDAIRLNPNFAVAHHSLGVILVNQGKKEEAITSLTKARDLFKKDGKTEEQVRTQMQLAVLSAQEGKMDNAIAQLKEVIKLKPDFVPPQYILAEILVNQGKPDEAIATLKKTRDLLKKEGKTEQVAEIQNNLALLLGKQQKVDEAIGELKDAINVKPDYAPAYSTLAIALNTKGKTDEAVTNFKKARDLFKEQGKTPQLVNAQFNLVLFLGQNKKLDESIAEARDLIRIKSDFAPAYAYLGQALAQQGKQKEAKENLVKARDLFKEKGETQTVDQIEQVLQKLEQKK